METKMKTFEVTFREETTSPVEVVKATCYAIEVPFLVFYNDQTATAAFKLYDVFKFKLIERAR